MSDLIVMVLNRHTKYRVTVFIKIALVHSYDTKKGEFISVHVLNSRSILFVTSSCIEFAQHPVCNQFMY